MRERPSDLSDLMVQFCVRKTQIKIHKGMQVDTLVPQAMKDVQSCEKLRGAAKKR